MATLKELGYSVLSQLYNFNISDDIDVDLDWIYYQVAIIKNKILYEETKTNLDINLYRYQLDVNCLPLTCTDVAECCNLKTDCNVYKIELPTNILFSSHALLTTVDKKKNFLYTEPHLLESIIYRRIKIAYGYWYFIQNRIYVFPNNPYIEYVSLRAVFERPEKLEALTNCDAQPCYNKDMPYPIEDRHIPFIEQYVVNLARASLTNVKDLTNNALDDAINTIRGDMQSLNNQLNSLSQRPTNSQNS